MGPESKRLWEKEIPPEPGTSPKRFASILGLEKAIRVRKPEGRDFSSIPPSAGYSDQSHHQRFQTRHGSRAVRLFSAVGDVQKRRIVTSRLRLQLITYRSFFMLLPNWIISNRACH